MFKKNIYKTIALLLAGVILSIGLASCSSGGSVRQVPIDVQVTGDTVKIPVNEVNKNINTRFSLPVEGGTMTFMAYKYDGLVSVRADICPPCRSKSFTLTKGTLVCDACGTVFSAATGKGIKGSCVAFPKESAPYQVNGDSIVVSKAALIKAYNDTLTQN